MACDVFVSYAHRDDTVVEGDRRDGFITRLVKSIKNYGGIKIGSDLEVFHDVQLAAGEFWEKRIYDELASCKVFIPVISPSWRGSKWADKEWTTVWSRVKEDAGLGTLSRILPVTFELPREERHKLPDRIKSLQYKRHFRGIMSQKEFELEADGLAEDVKDILRKIDQLAVKSNQKPPTAKVFLGFAFSKQMMSWRKQVRDELEGEDFSVVEISNLPMTYTALKEEIQAQLHDCIAAVHFLEKDQGPLYPAGGKNHSVAQLQFEAAKTAGCRRLLEYFWAGPEFKLKDIVDHEYLSFLKNVDYTTGTVTTFANSIVANLKKAVAPQPPSPTPPRLPVICVICESGDEEIADEIRRFFARKKGWPVSVPDLNVDQRSVSKSYMKVFQENEHFLFYWGQGGRKWCSNNYEDLIDARRESGGAVRDPSAALMYFGKEKIDYKESFEWPWRIARKWDRFDENDPNLWSFIADVEGRFKTGIVSTKG
jgi:TIR domain